MCGPVSGLVLNCQPPLPPPFVDFATIWPSSAGFAVAYTQALQVIIPVILSGVGLPRLTKLVVPLKTRAFPNLPAVVHVVPVRLPVIALPDASAVVVPVPSLKPYAATGPLGAKGVVALAIGEYAPAFAAASTARTR